MALGIFQKREIFALDSFVIGVVFFMVDVSYLKSLFTVG